MNPTKLLLHFDRIADAPEAIPHLRRFILDLAVRGKRPVLALVVEIEQVFSHCQKAFMRSGLWDKSAWPSVEDMPSVAALCKAVQEPAETLEELETHYAREHYSTLLY